MDIQPPKIGLYPDVPDLYKGSICRTAEVNAFMQDSTENKMNHVSMFNSTSGLDAASGFHSPMQNNQSFSQSVPHGLNMTSALISDDPTIYGPLGTREASVNWFKATQANNLKETATARGLYAEWFHGIISRHESERLLRNRHPGCFLVRVGESRLGYSLSFRDETHCRHYMIDFLEYEQLYHVVGEPIKHPSLTHLVTYHQQNRLQNWAGLLTQPCPQEEGECDYKDLIVTSQDERALDYIWRRPRIEASAPDYVRNPAGWIQNRQEFPMPQQYSPSIATNSANGALNPFHTTSRLPETNVHVPTAHVSRSALNVSLTSNETNARPNVYTVAPQDLNTSSHAQVMAPILAQNASTVAQNRQEVSVPVHTGMSNAPFGEFRVTASIPQTQNYAHGTTPNAPAVLNSSSTAPCTNIAPINQNYSQNSFNVAQAISANNQFSTTDHGNSNLWNQPPVTGLTSNQPTVTGLTSNQPPVTELTSNQPTVTGLTSNQPTVTGLTSNQPTVTGLTSNQPPVTGLTSNQPTVTGLTSNQPTMTRASPNQPTVTGFTPNAILNSTNFEKMETSRITRRCEVPLVQQGAPTPPSNTWNDVNDTMVPVDNFQRFLPNSLNKGMAPKPPVCETDSGSLSASRQESNQSKAESPFRHYENGLTTFPHATTSTEANKSDRASMALDLSNLMNVIRKEKGSHVNERNTLDAEPGTVHLNDTGFHKSATLDRNFTQSYGNTPQPHDHQQQQNIPGQLKKKKQQLPNHSSLDETTIKPYLLKPGFLPKHSQASSYSVSSQSFDNTEVPATTTTKQNQQQKGKVAAFFSGISGGKIYSNARNMQDNQQINTPSPVNANSRANRPLPPTPIEAAESAYNASTQDDEIGLYYVADEDIASGRSLSRGSSNKPQVNSTMASDYGNSSEFESVESVESPPAMPTRLRH